MIRVLVFLVLYVTTVVSVYAVTGIWFGIASGLLVGWLVMRLWKNPFWCRLFGHLGERRRVGEGSVDRCIRCGVTTGESFDWDPRKPGRWGA